LGEKNLKIYKLGFVGYLEVWSVNLFMGEMDCRKTLAVGRPRGDLEALVLGFVGKFTSLLLISLKSIILSKASGFELLSSLKLYFIV
jgi:hypothetical protein